MLKVVPFDSFLKRENGYKGTPKLQTGLLPQAKREIYVKQGYLAANYTGDSLRSGNTKFHKYTTNNSFCVLNSSPVRETRETGHEKFHTDLQEPV